MLTQARLKELLDYDPDSGVFTWRERPNNFIKIGQRAGTFCTSGHRQIGVDGTLHLANRLAWLWMTGGMPDLYIDHRDQDPANDAWLNLRLATPGQNSQNTKIRKDNKSGAKGVSWHRRDECWASNIRFENKLHHLGNFETIIDAVAARMRAERALFTHSPLCEV